MGGEARRARPATAAGVPSLGPGAERAVQALPQLPTPQSAALHAALDEVRRQRSAWMRLRVALRRGLSSNLPASSQRRHVHWAFPCAFRTRVRHSRSH